MNAVLTACVAVWTSGADAQEGNAAARADVVFDRAVRLTQTGDNERALAAFQESQALEPSADTVWNIAMCQRQLAQRAAAANSFREWVEAVGPDMTEEERGIVDAMLAELTPEIGRLVIVGAEDGATIEIDDGNVGTAPPPDWIAVEPGRHQVAAGGAGMAPARATVDVAAGEVLRVELSAGDTTVGEGEVVTTGGVLEIPYEDPYEPWFWSMVGIASASAAAMIATGTLAVLNWNDWYDGGGLDEELRGDGKTYMYVTDALLGLGLAAVAVGTWLFFELGPPEEEWEEEEVMPSLDLLPSGLVLSW
ncbi:MAG: PEGA domain-containing protein [Deltaproteobacteria bacterium]|nr:PEGA domain-containing protein [Deltaproteobacteria bacterium]